jgi:hydrogenase nickel incorporation protein HypA/HybF
MHELSVAVGIVELCNEHAGNARVRSVRLKVGTLCCLQPESLRFCFQVAAEGTALQGAALDIERVPAHSRCRDCGRMIEMQEALATCTCGSLNLDPPRGGNELRIICMEFEEAA